MRRPLGEFVSRGEQGTLEVGGTSGKEAKNEAIYC